MRTYFAVQGNHSVNSGWQQCLSWARNQIQQDNRAIQLLTARAGDKEAVVIAEITNDGERMIAGGRALFINRLMHGSEI
jgi:hypothetical protein